MGDNRPFYQTNQMDKKEESRNSAILEDPFCAGLRSEINGAGVFTTNPHVHSKHSTTAFTLHEMPLTNGAVRPINYNAFQSRQPTSATTAQSLGMVSRLDQNLGRQLRGSPQKLDFLPGLGQTGAMIQRYPSQTTASGQHSSTSNRDMFGAPGPIPQAEFRDSTQLAEKVRNWDIKIEDTPSIAKQQLQPQREIMEDLKQLLNREIDSNSQKYPPTTAAFTQSQSIAFNLPHLGKYTTTSPYKHATAMPLHSKPISPTNSIGTSPYKHAGAVPLSPKPVSPAKFTSPTHTPHKFKAPAQTPTRLNGQTHTPTKFNGMLNTPKKGYVPPTPRQSAGKAQGRHHRTATPEQRTIREMMGGKPVFTMGMKEQDDRCLIFDFFDQIKQWAANYTVHHRSLNAEQIHSLATHPAIAGPLGEPSKLTLLVTEKDMLTAMVASIICRHVITHALDDHSLRASAHPQADGCEDLAYRWTLVGANDHAAKHNLLLSQQHIYTTIKDAPDHRDWRAATASRLTFALLSSLSGLLATTIAPAALTDRNHTLTELYVKAYRIGFRLRMAPSRWSFQWPAAGAEFEPQAMVNENRLLYGDVLRTMTSVMMEPRAHEVRFAVSPTVARCDFGGGREERVVVHHAMVHITRKEFV